MMMAGQNVKNATQAGTDRIWIGIAEPERGCDPNGEQRTATEDKQGKPDPEQACESELRCRIHRRAG